MSDLNTLREYARFRAAGAIMSTVSSATDICLVDVAAAVAEVGTGRALGGQRGPFPRPPTKGDVSYTGSSAAISLSPEENEISFAESAALDELRTPKGQIRRQIRSFRAGQRLVYRERLARRLELLLAAMEEEEGEAWSDDSPESLRRMMLFLQREPTLRYPTVTVTPSAMFRAQWTTDPSRHFAAEFLANGEVRFVVFCPDLRHPDRVQRVSGMVSWENLMYAVEPYKVLRWAADARA
jgi:hypothetical protein